MTKFININIEINYNTEILEKFKLTKMRGLCQRFSKVFFALCSMLIVALWYLYNRYKQPNRSDETVFEFYLGIAFVLLLGFVIIFGYVWPTEEDLNGEKLRRSNLSDELFAMQVARNLKNVLRQQHQMHSEHIFNTEKVVTYYPSSDSDSDEEFNLEKFKADKPHGIFIRDN